MNFRNRLNRKASLALALGIAGALFAAGCGDDAGGSTTDEETSDEETSDEETSDEETSDEETSDEETSDEETSDEETSDEETSDEETVADAGGVTSDEETADGGDASSGEPPTEEEGGVDASAPVEDAETSWIVGGWISTADAWYGVLGIVDDLSSDNTFDLDNVVSFDGDFTFTGYKGAVYVGNEAKPTIEKWLVNDERELEMAGELSFMALGVQETFGASHNVIQVIDDDTAWFFDHANGRVITFNPSDMTTEGQTIDYYAIYDGLDLDADWPDIGDIGRVGDYLAVPMFWYSGTDDTIPVETRVALINTTNDEVTIATDTRCAGSNVMSNDSDGNLYFGPHAAAALYSAAGDAGDAVPCIIRILNGQDEIDPDYLIDLNEFGGGKAVGGLYQGAGDLAYVFQFEGDPTLGARARFEDQWTLYSIELGAEDPAYTLVEGWPQGHGLSQAFSLKVGTETKYYLTNMTEAGANSAYYEALPDGSVQAALNFTISPAAAVNY